MKLYFFFKFLSITLFFLFFSTAANSQQFAVETVCEILNVSAEDCAYIDSVSSNPLNRQWSVSHLNPETGPTSLRSADIGPDQHSCLVLNVSLPLHNRISFSLRVNAENLEGLVDFSADGQTIVLQIRSVSAFSSNSFGGWKQIDFTPQRMFSALNWCYIKNSAGTAMRDSVQLDTLFFDDFSDRFCEAVDMSTEDCALIHSISADPPNLPWYVSEVSTRGTTSLRSGDAVHDQTSCVVIDVPLPAPSRVSFLLRSDSDSGDFLFFDVNGYKLVNLFSTKSDASLRDWEQFELFVPGGTNNMRWCYTKNSSVTTGADSAWLDQLSFNIIPNPADTRQSPQLICQILDMAAEECVLITTVTSVPPTSPWSISTTATKGGVALSSVDIGDSQESCLIFGMSIPNQSLVQFSRRVSSQPGADVLTFAVNGQPLNYNLRAEPVAVLRDWDRELHILQAGNSTLSWCYTKDGNTREGEDRAWIDELAVTPLGTVPLSREMVCLVLDMNIKDCAQIISATADPPNHPWFISPRSTTGGTSLRSADFRGNGSSCLVLETVMPTSPLIRFSLRSQSIFMEDHLYFEEDGYRLLDIFTVQPDQIGFIVRDWEQHELLITENISSLRWCYIKGDFSNQPRDGGWLDQLSFSDSFSDFFNDITDFSDNPSARDLACLVLDITAKECNRITNIVTTPTVSRWFISPIAEVGGSSLRNGNIDSSQQSCLMFDLELPVPSVVGFLQRISSQAETDMLRFTINDQRRDYNLKLMAGIVLRDWYRILHLVPAGSNRLSWCYIKGDGDNEGNGKAYIDSLTVNSSADFADVSLTRELVCSALEMSVDDCAMITAVSATPPSGLVLPDSPNPAPEGTAVPWSISLAANQGAGSLRSGKATDTRPSCLVLEVALPAYIKIAFSLRISSGEFNNRLVFAAGSEILIDSFGAKRTGEFSDWEQREFQLLYSTNSLTWCYFKDKDSAPGDDRSWLDTLSLELIDGQILSLCNALDVVPTHCTMIRSVSYEPPQTPWLTHSAAFSRGGLALVSPLLDAGQDSCLTVEYFSPLPADGHVVFTWRNTSQSEEDILGFQTGNQQHRTGTSQWLTKIVDLVSTETTIRWCYSRNSAEDRQTAHGWLDSLSLELTARDMVCSALDLAPAACAMIQAVTYEPPDSPWIIERATFVAGDSSLRSPPTSQFQPSCLRLKLSLTANSVVSVAGRASSAGTFHELLINADHAGPFLNPNGQHINAISAAFGQTERDWLQEDYFLPTDISTLSWCYRKDSYESEGQDAVWIDNLSFRETDIPYQTRICNALDLIPESCALIQSISYAARDQRLWHITSETSVAGGSSLRSAEIIQFQATCLVFTVALPISYQFSFSRRLSFEGNGENLLFSINDRVVGDFTPPQNESFVDWQSEMYDLTPAVNELKWCYQKDLGHLVNAGQDAAWIDGLSFVPDNRVIFCEVLDLHALRCALIRAVTFGTPQNSPQKRWRTTRTEPMRGESALNTPGLTAGQNICLTVELNNPLPDNSLLVFSWRVTSSAEQDIFRFQAGAQQRQISNSFQWQSESIELDALETTFSWCYSHSSAAGQITGPAALDSVLLVTPEDRYRIEIAVSGPPIRIPTQTTTFQFPVTITAASTTLPPPLDWVLIASGVDNVLVADSTFRLVFDGDTAQVNVQAAAVNPSLPSTVSLQLADRASFLGATATSISYSLTFRQLEGLQVITSDTVYQSAPDAPIEIAVEVRGYDLFGLPFDPSELVLNVFDVDNTTVLQNSYPLTFAAGTAQTTITVQLTARGIPGRIEVAVISSNRLQSTASITLIPAPRVLTSINMSVADSSLVQTIVRTPVMTELTLTALDNYGDPIEAGNIYLRITPKAIIRGLSSTLIITIGADGMGQKTVEIFPGTFDTIVTIMLLRGNLDQSVQLLPEEGLQIQIVTPREVFLLRLTLVDQISPLQQPNPLRPIRANVHILGLDEHGVPVEFSLILLTTEGSTETALVTLDPLVLESTGSGGVMTVLEIDFTEFQDTTVTIGVETLRGFPAVEELQVLAQPNRQFQLSASQVCSVLEMSADDCAYIDSVSFASTSRPWLISPVEPQGDDLFHSSFIGGDQQSCLILRGSLPVNTQISFYLSIAANPADQVIFSATGGMFQLSHRFILTTGTRFVDRQPAEFTLAEKVNTLQWCFKTTDLAGIGNSTAWLESLSLADYRDRFCEVLDMSVRDCGFIDSVSADPPGLPWDISSISSPRGDQSLRSNGETERDQTSCLVAEISLSDNALARFSLRTRSEAVNDYLYFEADGFRLADRFSPQPGSALRDWEPLEFYISGSISNLKWCYTKNSSGTEATDGGWLDGLSFSTISTPAALSLSRDTVCQILDMSSEECELITGITSESTATAWFYSPIATAGGSSLRSGAVDDGQQSCIVFSVSFTAPTRVGFSRRVSSQAEAELLYFAAGDQRLSPAANTVSGDWKLALHLLQAGTSSLRWCYIGDDSISEEGSGWIDDLSLTPLTFFNRAQLCEALDLTTDNCSQIQSVAFEPRFFPWLITTDTAVTGDSSLQSGDIADNQQSCLVLELPLPANTVISVSGRTSSEGGFDQLQFIADKLRIDTLSRDGFDQLQFIPDQLRLDTLSARESQTERDWRQESYFLPTAITTLRWCYSKDDDSSEGADAAWIDNLSFDSSEVSYQSRICAALDLTTGDCSLIQSIRYDPPQLLWVITSETSVAGRTSLRSGDIGDSQDTCLILTLAIPADIRINFSQRLSFEANADMYYFASNVRRASNFTPPANQSFVDWQAQTFDLTPADSILRWCYAKNDSISRGNDSVWIDDLSLIAIDTAAFCKPLDLLPDHCSLIRSVTWEPPQNIWRTTSTNSFRGETALVTPPLDAGQSACVTIEFDAALPPGNMAFSWRTTAPSDQDMLRFQAGTQQRQISNAPEWQTEYIELDSFVTTANWCYSQSQSSPTDSQTNRAWLDNLLLITPADRYQLDIAVNSRPVLAATPPNSFRFLVTVTAASQILPPPPDWVLIVSGIDNIVGTDSTYALSFDSSLSAEVSVLSTTVNPELPATVQLALADRPSLAGATAISTRYTLPATELAVLQIMVASTVTQTAPDAPIEVVVTVRAFDNFDFPINPEGLMLTVEALVNAGVTQSSYALIFTDGLAQITAVVNLTRRGFAGRVEISVIGSAVVSTASIVLNPAPRELASITLTAAGSNLEQMTANTPITAELILTALDNYGNPIEAGNVSLQLSASFGAIVPPALVVTIGAGGTVRQTVEVQPQNRLDTVVTVQLLRNTLDPSVLLLPEGGIQIAIRTLRLLSQLQLSLVDAQSPLQQSVRKLPIRANIHLFGLNQYDQPSAFSGVLLSATADPSTTQVTLNPQQLSTTDLQGTVTVLEVAFPENLDTTVTIAIVNPATGVRTNNLVVRVLPDPRPPVQHLNVDSEEPRVTELDLVVALRWLANQRSSTATLVVNLAISSASITTGGINNLQQLFTDPAHLNRIDLNQDRRADALDLRILLRWLSGLRGTALAEQEVSEGLIRLLLDQP